MLLRSAVAWALGRWWKVVAVFRAVPLLMSGRSQQRGTDWPPAAAARGQGNGLLPCTYDLLLFYVWVGGSPYFEQIILSLIIISLAVFDISILFRKLALS